MSEPVEPCQPHPGCPCTEKCTIVLRQETKIEDLEERLRFWEKEWKLRKARAGMAPTNEEGPIG